MAVSLLPRDMLIRTGRVDHADWNHRPLLGLIERSRFRLSRCLLGEERRRSLLEVGYGSGIFLPELSGLTDSLHGVDVHDRHREVTEILARLGISAVLQCSSAEELPFEDGFFAAAVAVSTLEFIPDVPRAAFEIHRVLESGGILVAVMPGTSALLDAGLRLLTGESAKRDFADRRERVIPAFEKYFDVERRVAIPWLVSALVPLFIGVRFRKRAA